MTLFPLTQVCQSLRLRPRGKRKPRVNWFRKAQKTTKLLKYPNRRRNWASATSRDSGARTQPWQTRKFFQLLVSAKRKGNSTFRLAACTSVLQQCHPTSAAASRQQSHSTVGSPSKWTCQLLRLLYPSFYDWQSN